MVVNAPALRAYLLGQTTEEEAARLESQVLESDEVASALYETEDDLFDEFARGSLSTAVRQRFLDRYGAERSRLLVAHALANRRASSRDITHIGARRRRYWVPLAAAATVAAAVGLGFWTRPRPVPAPPANATVVVPPTVAPAVLALTLGTSRSASATPAVVLPPAVPSLELRVRLDPADAFERYAMELRSQSGESVWRTEIRQVLDPREPTLVGTVRANLLAAGDYELAVQGIARSGSAEDLGFAMVSIRR